MVALIQQRSLNSVKTTLLVSGLLGLVLVTAAENRQGLGAAAGQYLFWFAHALAGLILLLLITPALQGMRFNRLSLWQRNLLGAVLGTIAFAPCALGLEFLFSRIGTEESDAVHLLDVLSPRLLAEEWSNMAGPFIASWLLVNFTYPRRSLVDKTEPADCALFEVLPAALDRDVQWMKSDLNYLEVHTRTGQAVVLYSLRTAADDLSNTGILIHRSYWVAQQAVARVRRSSKGMFVVLHDDTELPVSRRRQKIVLQHFGANYRCQETEVCLEEHQTTP